MPYPLLADSDTVTQVVWSAMAIVVIGVAFKGLKMLASWMKDNDTPAGGTGFSLSDLKRYQKEGKMTLEEFEKAKAILLARMKGPAKKTAPATGGNPPADLSAGSTAGPTAGPGKKLHDESLGESGNEPGGENSTVHPPDEPDGQ